MEFKPLSSINQSMNLNIDLFNKYIFNNKFNTILGFQYQKANMSILIKLRIFKQIFILIQFIYSIWFKL